MKKNTNELDGKNLDETKHEQKSESDLILARTVEELIIHQEELRLQNDELILARNEAEERKNSYQLLFEMAPVSYLKLNSDGIVLAANSAAGKLLGVKKEKLINKRFQNFIAEEGKALFQAFNKRVFDKIPLNSCLVNLHNKKGQLISTQIEGSINDKETESFIVITDLTLYNIAQANLKRSNEERERLIMTMKIQEEERANLSEALHNSLGQNIYALQIRIEKFKIGDDINQFIIDLKNLVKPCYPEARNIAFELMPSTLKDFGVEEAISSLCKKKSTPETSLEFINEGKKIRFSEQFEIVIFRIIQEMINNIVKHAEASKGRILYSIESSFIKIMAEDNGIGFNVESINQSKSRMGLRSIKNRVSTLNGSLEVNSYPGKGTILKVVLPKPI